MKKLTVRVTLLALAVCALDQGRAAPARACINAVETDPFLLTPAGGILLGEKSLEDAKPALAAAQVRQHFPAIRSLQILPGTPPLALRALRIYALSVVRSQGKLDASSGWAPWGNYEWALETLRELHDRKQNPVSQADLAEAQGTLSRTRTDAAAALETLDQNDLLGSPYAYLALAQARNDLGDTGGRIAALRRCRVRSTDPARCALSPLALLR